jgi:aspartyl-tRNA(Asn)/glutamyl-tRNA(Gln) amidotransferase subunit B
VSGWLLSKLGGVLTENKLNMKTLKITPEDFAELLTMIYQKKVTGPNAVQILTEMALSGADPSVIMQEKNLGAIEDSSELVMVAETVLVNNPKVVEDWKSGKTNAIQFLVGQMMKATKGKAPPETARKLIEDELAKLK